MDTKSNKSFWEEFKEFAVKGSVIDLAVGVVIGSAFGKITTSLVNDIITPPLGLFLGKVNLYDRFFAISTRHFDTLEQARVAGVATVNYGQFLGNVIDFLFIALAIFTVIKQINRFKRRHANEPAPTQKKCQFCASDIPIPATRCPNCTSQL